MHQTLKQLPSLPISCVLDEIKAILSHEHELVLEAPPGAGKTTLVPLALLDEPWLAGKKIIMLEPRRMAARAAAQRMASLLGEPVGKRVGYRVRLESCVSKETRIEVITEGILARRLQSDPSLEGVGMVIFDEFHERNLDTDLCLALCLQARALLREESEALKLLVMSATLDGQAVAALLSKDRQEALAAVKVVRSQGRMFPIDIIYHHKTYLIKEPIIDPIVAMISQALERDSRSILVFLPGQGEIRKVQKALENLLVAQGLDKVVILPLYGSLSLDAQRSAIAPLNDHGMRKVVLSTDIAETSLTIDGVSVVIDSGLVREPAFDPVTGMTRLLTRRISKASSIQRMGRAGRLEPGRCYRLWHEEQQYQLVEYSSPEILQADLASLALQLLRWGVDEPAELHWLDQPPDAAYNQALDLLLQLGALEVQSNGRMGLTEHGKFMSKMPTHPRLAHMLLSSIPHNFSQQASMIAAILSDRDPFSYFGADLSERLSIVSGELSCPQQNRGWLKRTQQQVKVFEKLCKQAAHSVAAESSISVEQALGFLVACAYPDRIACKRKKHGESYRLSNGRSAVLNAHDRLNSFEWIAVAEVGGAGPVGVSGKESRIYLAAPLDAELFQSALSSRVKEQDTIEWDEKTQRFVAERRETIGVLIVSSKKLNQLPLEVKRKALTQFVKKKGLHILPWSDELRQWQSRVMLLNGLPDIQQAQPWPDVSDQGLLKTLDQWLALYLDDISTLSDFKKLDLKSILKALLLWPQPQLLEELAPQKIKVPSGSNIGIDYAQSPPILSVKLQEMFGCEQTPSIANGRIILLVHLLSPAKRPLQITQDIAGFWRGSYEAVKKDMKGRYPRHPWPDNPLEALPTQYTKRRANKK